VRERPDALIAVDPVKAEVARVVLAEGASMINDVSALRLDPALADVCAAAECALVLMHSRGTVADMARYENAQYHDDDVMGAIVAELRDASNRAMAAGVRHERIVLDPGIGFAKRGEHSVAALAELPKLVNLGFPVMVGVSRKRFLGELTGVQDPMQRDDATVGANVAALARGATWFRVHNVRPNRHALDVAAAILGWTDRGPSPSVERG
jgi:dihydropteroate synthase